MSKNAFIIKCVLLSAVCSVPAMAQDTFKDYGFIGGGLTVGEPVFSNEGTKAGAEPYLFYNSDKGFIDGSLFNYNPIPYVGITGNLRFAEVSDDFDDIPNGINDRDGNGELGITLGTVGARLTYLHDVTNEHNGYEIQAHFGRAYEMPLKDLVFAPYVEVNYRDNKLSEHLYSISAQESSASGLAAFDADDAWVYKGGVVTLYNMSDRWVAISEISLEHHDSDSPLVQNDLGWAFSFGAAYTF